MTWISILRGTHDNISARQIFPINTLPPENVLRNRPAGSAQRVRDFAVAVLRGHGTDEQLPLPDL